MKVKNNVKIGLLISIILVCAALIIYLVVTFIPDIDVNTLSETDKILYELGAYEGKTPMWKIICYILATILLVISGIVDLVMCRCHYCGKHIQYMNILVKYCPYCSKSIETTK